MKPEPPVKSTFILRCSDIGNSMYGLVGPTVMRFLTIARLKMCTPKDIDKYELLSYDGSHAQFIVITSCGLDNVTFSLGFVRRCNMTWRSIDVSL